MAPTKRKTDARRVASCSSAPDSKLDMDLARVIGMSPCRSGGLACSPGTGDVAHPAGAVVVIYSPARDAQIMFLRAPKPNAGVKEARAIRPSATTRDTRSTNASTGTQGGGKPFVSVAFSGTRGRFIAAGEKGHQPAAVVWSAETGKPLAVLRGHRYGVEAIAFCPGHDDRRVVTLGADNDGHVALWDWREGVNLARHFCGHDVSSGRLRSVAFNADGDSFVTAGAAHLKVWRVGSNSTRSGPHSHHDESKFHAKYRRLGGKSDGKVFGLVECGSKSADVGGHASHTWVAVCAPPPHITHTAVSAPSAPTDAPCDPADAVTYALSEEGVLCMLRGGDRVERWVDTRVTRGGALALGGEHVAVAAGDGVVRLFRVGTLAYRGTLPRPVRVGGHDEPETLDEVCETSSPAGVSFPDAIACAFDTDGTTLTVAYSDRSVVVWDTKNVANVRRLRVFFAHSGSVFGACPLPESTKDSTAPRGTFATCGADGSVRLWHLGWEEQGDAGGEPGDAPIGGDIKRIHPTSSTAVSAMYAAPDPSRESAALREVEKQAGAVADECAVARAGGNGLRCVAARPDGKELVVGDGCGNVRVFDLGSRTERLRLAAHDAEVLSVAYGPNACADDSAVRTSASSPDSTGFPFVDTAEAPEQRLVSSGRDGLVHIYDASLNSDGSPGVYRLEDTVDDHDAAVTGAVIAGLGSECKLVTTGADRKVIFRNLAPLSRVKKSQASKGTKASKAFASETMPRGVVHGVALDARGKTCVTAGADGRLRLWSIANGKTTRAYPCADEGAGEALRVDADPHGRFAAVSHADKTVRVYDVKSGVLVGRCVGHGTAVTALAFMNCGSRLVTGGADGTVCVWRLPGHLGLSPPARAPLRAVTNVSAAKCAVLVGTHSDGSLREHAGTNDRYAETALEPELIVKSVTGDATDADPALMNASGVSSIPSLAFDELPKWAARAAANASEADASEKREREKLDNLAKVAAGSKWSANAPGGYVPKRTGLSASVLDHGDVDLEVDDDDEDLLAENENSPENAAEKENAHPIAPGSVVSLYTPLDDDDDALYYAESEPGGDGSVTGTFGVVTVSPAHEQKSEHGLAAVDERDAPAEGAEGADTAVPKIEDAPAPDTVVQEDAAKPKGVFARVAAMLGGKKPASHLKTQSQDVQQPKPIQTPCAEPPRSESPTSHRGHRFDVPSGGEEDGDAEEVATEYETESDDEPPAVPLALRFDDDDESMGKHSDDVATEPDGKQKENKALRDSFSGRFRRRAREPLPLHELIDPKSDQPSDDNNENEDDGRRLPVGDMVSAIEAVEREDANRTNAAAGVAKGSSTTPASNSTCDDNDETNVVRKSVEELRASLPRLRTSPVERTRETPVEAAVTSSGEHAEAESETKFEPDATWPPLPEDMPSDDDDDEEDGGDGTDANGEKEEKEEKEEPTSTTTPAVTTGDDEDATADAVRASIDAAVTHVEVELDATADDVDETADATAVKVEADVDATEPNATETCVATDGPIPSSEPSTLRSSQGGMTTGDRSSMRSSASSKGLRASLKKRRGRARRIIAAIAERTKRASLATSTNTSTDANANAKGAEGADTAVPRMEEPEPAEPTETLAKADTDCPSNGPSSPEPAVSPVASTPAPTAVSDALAAVDALDDAVRRSLATVRASVGACDSDERQLVESRLRSLASLILGGGVDTSTRSEVRAVQTDELDVEEHAASEPVEPSTSDTSGGSHSPGAPKESSILAKMPQGLVTSFEVPASLERAINATMERALAAYSERLIETVRISVAASDTSSR